MTLAAGASPTGGALRRAVVTLEDVSVRFPRRADPVVRGVTLRLAPGEHVLVLGASGSGKSTVLSVITGVVPHSVSAVVEGEVAVGTTGTARTPVVDRARHVGVMAQDPGSAVCLPGVEQELALPLENQGVAPQEIGPRIARALSAVGAQDLRGRSTAALSGGESQRVALAAALVAEPDVLLLDEPTAMLDPAGIASVRGSLADALGRYGPAVVLVEHRLDAWAGAAGFAGLPARTLALDETGAVLADGPTEAVLRAHAGALHCAGCWLPLGAELLALTGTAGGLAASANVDLLRTLADEAPARGADGPGPDGSGGPGSVPALAARGLAVGRGEPRARRRRGRPPAAVPVLSDVDLTVAPGEIVALLGANGVGKSTLLLTLAGLLAPLSGRVEGARPGLVFQNPEHQFLAHTVRDEIAHGLPAAGAAAIVERQLHRHRLAHLAEQNPFRLSGGEKRRLSLAAMLAHHRPVLLADEPTLGLDRKDSVDTATVLREAADEGTAVVLSTHDLRMVATLADRVVLLGDGGVLADGPTVDVLADQGLMAPGRLTLPALVAWLLGHVPGHAVAHVLRELDAAVGRPDGRRAGAAP